ncbi:MAG: Response regulator receiver protein [Pedobacter sp.]|jgi:DNA-binding NarL/FixJ family response regulator|nr:Response regulator receiver protein [Pedobacter sp.]
MLKLILAEDDSLVRNGIRMLLESEGNFEIVGEAANGSEVLQLISGGVQPDVVVTDMNMPGMDGKTLIRELKKYVPTIPVLVLSQWEDDENIDKSFSEGAHGYLLKTVNAQELFFAVKQVSKGHKYLSSDLSIKYLQRSVSGFIAHSSLEELNIELNSREKEIVKLIGLGLTNNEIADKLFISRRTVEGHRQSLIEKTGCRNTATLVKFGVVNGLID